MFLSLVQTQAFALLCLCSLVISSPAYEVHQVPLVEEQHPISITGPLLDSSALTTNTEQSPIDDEPVEQTGRNATIKLFPASTTPFRPNVSFGCKETTFYTTTLATDVCLSGDYYLSHNLQISEQPICPDGSGPYMAYYPNRGCAGKPDPYKSGKDIPEHCLYGGHVTKYWSVVFRCSIWPTLIQGADKHQEAIPPPAAYNEVPRDGKVISHLFPACNGKRVGGPKEITVPVDRCLTTLGSAIVITTAAVCANGTRARWARFQDSKCGYGEITMEDGLIDISDSDIAQCLPTRNMRAGQEKISSMAFWCDGFGEVKKPKLDAPKEEEPKKPRLKEPSTGSVSESACMPNRAPFFNHPQVDTCVNMKTDKMKIYSAGVCGNGTQALMALYTTKSCSGSPAEFRDVAEEDLRTCLDLQGVESFAFWCSGEGLGGPPKQDHDGPAKTTPTPGMGFLMAMILAVFAGFVVIMVGLWVAFNTRAWARFKVCHISTSRCETDY
jgi:hypothetical protein